MYHLETFELISCFSVNVNAIIQGRHFPGTESMGNPWKKHGENSMDSLENHGAWSQSKIPWFSWGNFHAFHAIPHESMESMESEAMENHGKHWKHGNL